MENKLISKILVLFKEKIQKITPMRILDVKRKRSNLLSANINGVICKYYLYLLGKKL